MHSNNINISPFDSEALIYDQNFTYSKIGKAQREIVWTHLSNLIKYAKIKSVLEVNCGTGEDALFLNKKEISVLPTDVSEKMVELALAMNSESKLVLGQEVLEIKKAVAAQTEQIEDVETKKQADTLTEFLLLFAEFFCL
jgi:SAM-dependent methyltransferase